MNFLFVVDEFPFPPRNGVTIPVANFIELLKMQGNRVDLLLVDVVDEQSGVVEKCEYISSYAWLALRRQNIIIGLLNEVSLRRPLFMAWKPLGVVQGDRLLDRYDVVWTSPIRAFGLWIKVRKSLNIEAGYLVAAINDSYAMTLFAISRRKAGKFGKLLFQIRGLAMKFIERKLLSFADLICVQSQSEAKFLASTLDVHTNRKVFELKNGVGGGFWGPRLPLLYDLLFVGVMDDNYRSTIHWFISDVYAKLNSPRPSFCIVGSKANEGDIRLFEEYGIKYFAFVQEIDAYYRSSKILLAPIFKGFGTINKVLEGMAAGCVVIGDPTAFNGIESFVPGRDGLVATTAVDFSACIASVLENDDLADRIGASARELMKKDFSWKSRLDSVVERLPNPDR